MKTTRLLILSAILGILAATTVTAGTATPRIERRETRQHARIREGVRSGELTRGEARRLELGQRHVDRLEARAKADGRVTPRERVRISRAQNRQSRHIARLKHNGDAR